MWSLSVKKFTSVIRRFSFLTILYCLSGGHPHSLAAFVIRLVLAHKESYCFRGGLFKFNAILIRVSIRRCIITSTLVRAFRLQALIYDRKLTVRSQGGAVTSDFRVIVWTRSVPWLICSTSNSWSWLDAFLTSDSRGVHFLYYWSIRSLKFVFGVSAVSARVVLIGLNVREARRLGVSWDPSLRNVARRLLNGSVVIRILTVISFCCFNWIKFTLMRSLKSDVHCLLIINRGS